MSDWDDLQGQDWFIDLPEEAKKEIKAKHDGEAAAQRLLERTKTDHQKQLDAMAKDVAEVRKSKVDAAFKEAGVLLGAAEFYPADAPLDPAKIKEWGEPRGFAAPESAASTTETPADRSMVGSTPGGSAAVAGTAKPTMTMAQWESHYRSNPEAAAASLAKGEVILPRSPYEIYSEPFTPRGG